MGFFLISFCNEGLQFAKYEWFLRMCEPEKWIIAQKWDSSLLKVSSLVI